MVGEHEMQCLLANTIASSYYYFPLDASSSLRLAGVISETAEHTA